MANKSISVSALFRGKLDKKPVRPKNMDLIYLESSPTYCEKDIYLGSSGKIYRIFIDVKLFYNLCKNDAKCLI